MISAWTHGGQSYHAGAVEMEVSRGHSSHGRLNQRDMPARDADFFIGAKVNRLVFDRLADVIDEDISTNAPLRTSNTKSHKPMMSTNHYPLISLGIYPTKLVIFQRPSRLAQI